METLWSFFSTYNCFLHTSREHSCTKSGANFHFFCATLNGIVCIEETFMRLTFWSRKLVSDDVLIDESVSARSLLIFHLLRVTSLQKSRERVSRSINNCISQDKARRPTKFKPKFQLLLLSHKLVQLKLWSLSCTIICVLGISHKLRRLSFFTRLCKCLSLFRRCRKKRFASWIIKWSELWWLARWMGRRKHSAAVVFVGFGVIKSQSRKTTRIHAKRKVNVKGKSFCWAETVRRSRKLHKHDEWLLGGVRQMNKKLG